MLEDKLEGWTTACWQLGSIPQANFKIAWRGKETIEQIHCALGNQLSA